MAMLIPLPFLSPDSTVIHFSCFMLQQTQKSLLLLLNHSFRQLIGLLNMTEFALPLKLLVCF